MRFLLDENVPRSLAHAFADRGHDAAPIPERLRSSADSAVLAHARRTRRILVTLDTDFGALVFATGRPPPPAVVLLRLPPAELAQRLPGVVAAIEAALTSEGAFVVVDHTGVRVRSLPQR